MAAAGMRNPPTLAGERRAVEGLPVGPLAVVIRLEAPLGPNVEHVGVAAASGLVRAQPQPCAVPVDEVDLERQVGLVVDVLEQPVRVGGEVVDHPRAASRSPATGSRGTLRRLTLCDRELALTCGDVSRRRVVRWLVDRAGFVHTAEVAGSKPATPTTRTHRSAA